MTQRERTAWALYASEGWYSAWVGREVYDRGFGKSHALYAKTRALVVFDRVLNGRFEKYGESERCSSR